MREGAATAFLWVDGLRDGVMRRSLQVGECPPHLKERTHHRTTPTHDRGDGAARLDGTEVLDEVRALACVLRGQGQLLECLQGCLVAYELNRSYLAHVSNLRSVGVQAPAPKPVDRAAGRCQCREGQVGVCKVLRMKRLAPDIVMAIREGRQPRHPNLQAMRGRQGDVPLDWDDQRRGFGFVLSHHW